MYHRVIPAWDVTPAVEPGMVVEPETLARHFSYLTRKFDVVPLSHLTSASFATVGSSRSKPMCIITFDDGWYDFYIHAYPIIKTFQLPVTVFLPTDFIGTDRWPWPDRLGYLLGTTDTRKLNVRHRRRTDSSLVRQILRQSGTKQDRLERAIGILKSQRLADIDTTLTILSRLFGKVPTFTQRAFVSWDEAKEMAESGLVSYGSHTASHPILTTLSEEEVRSELERSRDMLIAQGLAAEAFIPFCYPNGDYSRRLMSHVREAGYHLAVTTRCGWNQIGDDLFSLRRVGLHQDVSGSESMFAARIAGQA